MVTQATSPAIKSLTGNKLFGFILKLRNRHFFLMDFILFLIIPYMALCMRLDTFIVPERHFPVLLAYTFTALFVRLLVFYRMDIYRRYWIYASSDDLLQIGLATAGSTVLILLMIIVARAVVPDARSFPRSVPFIDALLILFFVGATRFGVWFTHGRRYVAAMNSRRVLILGAGDTGSMIVREMMGKPHLGYKPVAFMDDNPRKYNVRIHDLPVLGGRKDFLSVIEKYKIDRVIIAMPTAPEEVIGEISSICDLIQVDTEIVPNISEILDGTIHDNMLHEVDIRDLLHRDPVRTNVAEVRRMISGKCVMVTGGGGSIGSELCRQLLFCQPAELVILGHGENSVFNIYHEIRNLGVTGPRLTPIIADIRFDERIAAIFERVRPDIVFHAAAHKHVPLMELNPVEAITNNVLGTQNMLNAAMGIRVKRFVMISTDKAVNPINVMGASKRVAEMLVQQTAQNGGHHYCAVRFGNVLGSRGSVVETFQKQIASGGPVTVTDPNANRYFMTISEAVQLVLHASTLGQGGEIFVLDMGDPVYIDRLARDMIELSGLEPETDIEIQYVGLRPGDKLNEELFVDGEKPKRTKHQKIFEVSRLTNGELNGLVSQIEALIASARCDDMKAVTLRLRKLVPTYQPK
ncbi:MAG: nucleoside-diphosphate sugar epimerase/dehydratase [Anaerolineae bacterium]|nr:MAG: nucleoside-diphosphate sugar epimerase/dehydratase [Anaerolineae bacterium]